MKLRRTPFVAVIVLATAILFSGCAPAAPPPAPTPTSPPKAAPPTPAAPKAAAVPAALPKATMDFLAALKKDASFLAGIDDELKVPQEWIDGAKKEGKLAVIHTMDAKDADVFLRPFKERYPFIQVDWQRGSDEEKTKAIVTAQAGRATVDILFGVFSKVPIMNQAGLTRDLRDLPAWKFVPEGARAVDGTWVGQSSRHWAMSYNTKLVKEADLPKTWDELLTNPIFRGGKLALSDEPEQWLLPLWGVKGEQWTKDFATKLIAEVKPQLRKEDLNAMVELVGAGEFPIAIPSAEYRVVAIQAKGAPVAWWSPEPMPVSVSAQVSLKTGANPNAARLFVNWFISKEGQLSQFSASKEAPMRKEVQAPETVLFPERVIGKKEAPNSPQLTADYGANLNKFWTDLWLKGGGPGKKP